MIFSPLKASRACVDFVISAFVFGLMLVALVPQTTHAQSLDRIERERALSMLNIVKGDLKSNYYDPNFRGMDVDARFKTAEEKVKAATSLGQAFGIIAQALLDLNDSHTLFIPPRRPETITYGWQMQRLVTSVTWLQSNPAATPPPRV